MNAIDLLNELSPVKGLPEIEQSKLLKLAAAICQLCNINPMSDEYTAFCGYITDNTNMEAVSSWVFTILPETVASDTDDLVKALTNSFQTKINSTQILGMAD